MTIHTSAFTNNMADSRGGAIESEGTLSIYGSSFSGNVASRGGAISNAGTLFVFGSSITGNTGRVSGGGIYTRCGGRTTLLLTTVAGNSPDNVVSAPVPDPSCPQP
jgi:predicted outer membrane repeat protein